MNLHRALPRGLAGAGFLMMLVLAGAGYGQDADEAARKAEIAREVEREAARAAREVGQSRVDIEVEMREAESRLAEAARRVAELSTRRLPGLAAGSFASAVDGKPVLGVNIGTRGDGDEPVEGVEIMSVSPGGAAAEAGLRAGDIITRINDEDLSAQNSREATRRLLDFMAAVEEGDELDIEYLRAGRSATVVVTPRIMTHVFSFSTDGQNFTVPPAPVAPAAPVPSATFNRFVFISDGSGLGDMEMVSLTAGLGRYFGTEKGLLVVRAPEDADTYKLQDGDVILDIDGREPNSVSHAVRILGSYQEGETLKVRIMRDQREQTLDIVVPDDRTGALLDGASPTVDVDDVAVPRIVIEKHTKRF